MMNLCWASGDDFLLAVYHIAMGIYGGQFPPLDVLNFVGISAMISSQKLIQKEQHQWLLRTTYSDFAMKKPLTQFYIC